MRLIVGKIRKDGKIPVEYIFPIVGKRFNNLLTQDHLRQLLEAGDVEDVTYK